MLYIRVIHFAQFFEKFEAEVHQCKFKCNLLLLMEKYKNNIFKYPLTLVDPYVFVKKIKKCQIFITP